MLITIDEGMITHRDLKLKNKKKYIKKMLYKN